MPNKTANPGLNIFNFLRKTPKNRISPAPTSLKRENRRIDYFKKQIKKKEKKRATIQERRHRLRLYLEKAGLGIEPSNLSRKLFNICIIINLAISAFLIYHFSTTFGITWTTIFLSIVALWILVFVVLLFALWVLFYVIIDLKIFKRKANLEDVLPDYLQLTASNIKAGMTIDRALWYAVRPRFGILAKEIETVAKETMKGDDLRLALKKFTDKYDSLLLKRSINLLIEGIESGGQIGDLLNKIAINIQENKIMRREMSANVTNYVIFISFATLVAAPVLFALSGILIKVITGLSGALGGITGAASTTGLPIAFSGTGIQYSDFRIFAIVSLMITSFFSAMIIAIIKKGNVRFGLKYIITFMFVVLILFFISDKIMGKLVGAFI